jgi:hypothetical protein
LTAVSTRAVDGGVVLQQVVRADAEEIELATERVHEVHRGRHLDHRAERRQPARRARAGEPRFLLGEDARDPAHMIEVRDHRDEDLHVALDLWIVEAGTTYDTPVRRYCLTCWSIDRMPVFLPAAGPSHARTD